MTTAPADVSPYRGRRRAPSSGPADSALPSGPAEPTRWPGRGLTSSADAGLGLATAAAPATRAEARRAVAGPRPGTAPTTRAEARRAAPASGRVQTRRAPAPASRTEARRAAPATTRGTSLRAGAPPARTDLLGASTLPIAPAPDGFVTAALPAVGPADQTQVLASVTHLPTRSLRAEETPTRSRRAEQTSSRSARRAAERTRRRAERLDVVGRSVRETVPPSEPAAAARPASRTEARRYREEANAARARARRQAIAAQRSRIASTAGIAGALAVTAVAAQALSGPFAGDPASADSTSDRTPRTDVLAAPSGTMLMVAPTVATPPPRVLPVSRTAKRTPAATVLAGCDGRVGQDWANGRIPLSDLCKLTFAPGHRLRADAAVALARLNLAYRAQFGDDLCLTDSYRSYASQMSLAARKPGLAARPGTSEHGWGLAVDMCDGIESFRSDRHQWMRDNAPEFGWDNPPWARADGKRPEAWHWEFVAGTR